MANKKSAILLACVAVLVFGTGTLWALIQAPACVAAKDIAALNAITVGKTTEAELLSRPQFQKIDRMCLQEACMYHAPV